MNPTRAFCCALAVLAISTSTRQSLAQGSLLQPKPTAQQTFPESGGIPKLSPPALELAEHLNVLETMKTLRAKQDEYQRSGDTRSLLETVVLKQKLHSAIRYASIEVEEAVAAIDGDLALANMLLAYASSRRDRALMLNNVATFVGSGSFGILDSSTDIKIATPTSQIFGIIGNSIATGLPIVGLHRPEYKNPRRGQERPNMLAPIFGRPFHQESYDPLVWSYIEGAATPGSSQTRHQQLLQGWRTLRGLRTTGSAAQNYIDAIVGIPGKDDKISVEMLKTRAELLYDLRGLVQLMYRDISELNTAIMTL